MKTGLPRDASPLPGRIGGYEFRDASLLELALTHPSWTQGQKGFLLHNERLEFLGDAVLQTSVSDHLYRHHPRKPEGWLTKTRAHLVNRTALAEMAVAIGLGAWLRLGAAEERHGGRERPSNLANAMEAVIGAIFLDGGWVAASAAVIALIGERLARLPDEPEPENAKGILQEHLHAMGKIPSYAILSETGPAHDRIFVASVEVGGRVLGEGSGRTKKEAETRAATAAFQRLQKGSGGKLEKQDRPTGGPPPASDD